LGFTPVIPSLTKQMIFLLSQMSN